MFKKMVTRLHRKRDIQNRKRRRFLTVEIFVTDPNQIQSDDSVLWSQSEGRKLVETIL
jgi:hypothetical protein